MSQVPLHRPRSLTFTTPAPLRPPALTPRDRTRASDPGNNLRSAQAISAFLGPRELTNRVSASDPDFYRLTIARERTLSLTVGNPSGQPIALALLDNRGNVALSRTGSDLALSVRPRSSAQFTYTRIPAGTYYVRLESNSADASSYRLRLSVSNFRPPRRPPCGCAPA